MTGHAISNDAAGEAMTLAEFIAARLDEDKAAAWAASGGTVVGEPRNWRPAPGGDQWEAHRSGGDGEELLVALRPGLPRPPDVMGGYWGALASRADYEIEDHGSAMPLYAHIARHDPARVLREVAAKRQILAAYQEALRIQDGFRETSGEEANREALEKVCRLHATAWDDHPDYRADWAHGGDGDKDGG